MKVDSRSLTASIGSQRQTPFFPGDAAGDGGIFVNGQSPGAGASSYVEYRFDGVLEDGMQYDFSTFLYQASGSFANSDIQLGVIDPAGDVDDPSNFTVVENTFRNGINNGSDLKRVNLRYNSYVCHGRAALGIPRYFPAQQ